MKEIGAMPNESTIPLTLLPRELSAYTGKPAKSYRYLYSKVLDGVIPAELINGRWSVQRANVPAIAAELGLTAPPDPSGAHSRKTSKAPAPTHAAA
jgi:hypothetical protein